MVLEGHAAVSGNLDKCKPMSSLTSTSAPSLKGKTTGGKVSSSRFMMGNYDLSTREKYLSLQKKFEELTARQKKNKAILESASSKLKDLQDECDMLIDSIAPHVSTQPSLLHFLERMSREDANLNGPGGGSGHGGTRGSGGR